MMRTTISRLNDVQHPFTSRWWTLFGPRPSSPTTTRTTATAAVVPVDDELHRNDQFSWTRRLGLKPVVAKISNSNCMAIQNKGTSLFYHFTTPLATPRKTLGRTRSPWPRHAAQALPSRLTPEASSPVVTPRPSFSAMAAMDERPKPTKGTPTTSPSSLQPSHTQVHHHRQTLRRSKRSTVICKESDMQRPNVVDFMVPSPTASSLHAVQHLFSRVSAMEIPSVTAMRRSLEDNTNTLHRVVVLPAILDDPNSHKKASLSKYLRDSELRATFPRRVQLHAMLATSTPSAGSPTLSSLLCFDRQRSSVELMELLQTEESSIESLELPALTETLARGLRAMDINFIVFDGYLHVNTPSAGQLAFTTLDILHVGNEPCFTHPFTARRRFLEEFVDKATKIPSGSAPPLLQVTPMKCFTAPHSLVAEHLELLLRANLRSGGSGILCFKQDAPYIPGGRSWALLDHGSLRAPPGWILFDNLVAFVIGIQHNWRPFETFHSPAHPPRVMAVLGLPNVKGKFVAIGLVDLAHAIITLEVNSEGSECLLEALEEAGRTKNLLFGGHPSVCVTVRGLAINCDAERAETGVLGSSVWTKCNKVLEMHMIQAHATDPSPPQSLPSSSTHSTTDPIRSYEQLVKFVDDAALVSGVPFNSQAA